jgi:hypothetical protein
MVIVALGVPINEPLRFAVLFGIALLVFTNTVPVRYTRWSFAALILACSLGLQTLIPGTRIQEGHNIFLRLNDGEALENSLPSEVYKILKEEFDQQYPLSKRCDAKQYGCWAYFGVPTNPFAFSADGSFTKNEWSRVSADINFHDVSTLKLGDVNNLRYNWYDAPIGPGLSGSDISRSHPPFFVVFKWPSEAVGSQLCWSGRIVWELPDQMFQPLFGGERACKTIQEIDIGMRVFGISILHAAPLSMEFEKSRRLRTLDALILAVRILSAVSIATCVLAGGLRRYGPLAFGLAGLGLMVWTAPEFLYQLSVYQWGGDGLTHESYGREILQAALDGKWSAAFQGFEPVYYFMPGLRYFWALGNLVFGDTNYLYLAVLALMPLALFSLTRVLTTWSVAAILLVVFVSMHAGDSIGLGLQAYVQTAELGLPDTFGYVLFLAAVYFGIRLAEREEADKAFVSGLLFALAVFVRPNLVLGAAAFLLMCTYKLWRSARYGDLLLLAFGVLPAALMPLHNWIFGHRFVPLTSAADIKENLLMPPSKYIEAALWILSLGGSYESFHDAQAHLERWLTTLPQGSKVLHLLVLVGAVVAIIANIGHWRIATLGITTVALQGTLLFWHPDGRYALLTWLFTTLVFITGIVVKAGQVQALRCRKSTTLWSS